VRNYRIILLPVIITGLVISLALLPGCLSQVPDDTSSRATAVTTTATPAIPEPGAPLIANTSEGPAKHPVAGSPEKIQITINSATMYHTLPGFTNKAGTGISVINVSIKNNLATDYRISREYLYIKSERDTTLEHGGDRLSSDVAGKYLRFPITIGPGETKTGSLVYIVNYGTRTNDLILSATDVLRETNVTVLAKVDLNKVYIYA
jgi:hypothetical protein